MALVTPTRAQIAFINYFTDYPASAMISATSEQSQWRKENLIKAMRSKRWRSTSAAAQSLYFQLGAGIVGNPGVFALIDSNLRSGQAITLEMSDESTVSSGGTGYAKWNLTSYAQSRRKVMRFYLGAPDTVGANGSASRSFVKITLAANGTGDSDLDGVNDAYHELGLPFICAAADVVGFLLDLGLSRKVIDPSIVAETDSGARYVDPKPTYHQVEMDTSYMPEASSKALMALVDEVGVKRHVLADIWAPRSDTTLISQGAYYGNLSDSDDVISFEASLNGYDDTGFRFIEARA